MADKPLILYQSVMPEDYSQILALLTGPFTDQEPLNQSVLKEGKCTRQRSNQAKEHHSKVALTSGYSVTAKLDGQVVGAMVSALTSKEKYETPSEAYIPEIGQLLSHLYKQRCENFPFREFVLVRLCVVHPKYQKMGIGKRMLEWTIQMAKANGVPGIVAETSGIYSQRSFSKFGFRTISEILYHQYKDEKGNLVFPDTGEHTSIQLMYLEL